MSGHQDRQVAITRFTAMKGAKTAVEGVIAMQIMGVDIETAGIIARSATAQVTKNITDITPQLAELPQDVAIQVIPQVLSDIVAPLVAYAMSRDNVTTQIKTLAANAAATDPELAALVASNPMIVPQIIEQLSQAISGQLTESTTQAITTVLAQNALNLEISGVMQHYNTLLENSLTEGKIGFFKGDAGAEEYVTTKFVEACKAQDVGLIRQCLNTEMVSDIKVGAHILREKGNNTLLANTIKTADAIFEYSESLALPKGHPAKTAAMQKLNSFVQFVNGDDAAVFVPQPKILTGTTKAFPDATVSEELFKLHINGSPLYKHVAGNPNGTKAFDMFCSRHFAAHPELVPDLSAELKNEIIDFVSQNHARCSDFQIKMAPAIILADYEARLAQAVEHLSLVTEAEAAHTVAVAKVEEKVAVPAKSSVKKAEPAEAAPTKKLTMAEKVAALKAKMKAQNPEYALSQQELFLKACREGDADSMKNALDSGKITDIRAGADALSPDNHTLVANTVRTAKIFYDHTLNYKVGYLSEKAPAKVKFSDAPHNIEVHPEMVDRMDGIIAYNEQTCRHEPAKKPDATVLPNLFFKLQIVGQPLYQHLANGKEGFTTLRQLMVNRWLSEDDRPHLSDDLKKEMMDVIVFHGDATSKDLWKSVITQEDYQKHSVEVMEQLLHDADVSHTTDLTDITDTAKLQSQIITAQKWIGYYVEHVKATHQIPDYSTYHHSAMRAYLHASLADLRAGLSDDLVSQLPKFTLEQDIAAAKAKDLETLKEDIDHLEDAMKILSAYAQATETDEHKELEKAIELMKAANAALTKPDASLKVLEDSIKAEQVVLVEHLVAIMGAHPDVVVDDAF